MKTCRLFLAALTFLLPIHSTAANAGDNTNQIVQFAKGHSPATLRGRIKGYQTISYIVRARTGQTLSVTLDTRHGANYFNVVPPDAEDGAIFIGEVGGRQWTGTLPADGGYKVLVYLMRSAARRKEAANYILTIGITGATAATSILGKAPASDARVPGTPYHATGSVPCSMGEAAMQRCELGVIRGKPGNAEVHVTPPGGFERMLTFMGSKVTTDGSGKVKASKQGDMWSIEVNGYERYQIPEAVIDGG